MPRVIKPDLAEDPCSLEECADALAASGFGPEQEESLLHAAGWLARLGQNRAFLGDLLVDQLARRDEEEDGQSYGPQVICLSPQRGDCFLRAAIWPGEKDALMRASGHSPFLYGLPHDHNFHFLTLGYFGPGYWSDYYDYEYSEVAGWSGEPVDLRFVERARLEPGKIMHYRAHRDVHRQLPAEALSVSINVMHRQPAMGWLDQYSFDLEKREVCGILGRGSSEAFLRIAVALGGEEALDLADRFAGTHPSDRMRLTACDALAAQADGPMARDAIWARAERSGSRLLAAAAARRRVLEGV